VTLLLCNAAAMEALPIFLDKLVPEVFAILISVTAVLLMGEVIPQAVCSKYGLVIGSAMSFPVRALMMLTSPISYPIAKLLDWALGGEHASLFRRKQLKALVTLHAKDEGFGGRLTADEIQIITGALDLTRKTAYHSMTPLDKVGASGLVSQLVSACCPAQAHGDARSQHQGLALLAALTGVHKQAPPICVRPGEHATWRIPPTPLVMRAQVFMLSSDQKLDDATVSAIMASKPFSRLPVRMQPGCQGGSASSWPRCMPYGAIMLPGHLPAPEDRGPRHTHACCAPLHLLFRRCTAARTGRTSWASSW
jgi:hypothetical protein